MRSKNGKDMGMRVWEWGYGNMGMGIWNGDISLTLLPATIDDSATVTWTLTRAKF